MSASTTSIIPPIQTISEPTLLPFKSSIPTPPLPTSEDKSSTSTTPILSSLNNTPVIGITLESDRALVRFSTPIHTNVPMMTSTPPTPAIPANVVHAPMTTTPRPSTINPLALSNLTPMNFSSAPTPPANNNFFPSQPPLPTSYGFNSNLPPPIPPMPLGGPNLLQTNNILSGGGMNNLSNGLAPNLGIANPMNFPVLPPLQMNHQLPQPPPPPPAFINSETQLLQQQLIHQQHQTQHLQQQLHHQTLINQQVAAANSAAAAVAAQNNNNLTANNPMRSFLKPAYLNSAPLNNNLPPMNSIGLPTQYGTNSLSNGGLPPLSNNGYLQTPYVTPAQAHLHQQQQQQLSDLAFVQQQQQQHQLHMQQVQLEQLKQQQQQQHAQLQQQIAVMQQQQQQVQQQQQQVAQQQQQLEKQKSALLAQAAAHSLPHKKRRLENQGLPSSAPVTSTALESKRPSLVKENHTTTTVTTTTTTISSKDQGAENSLLSLLDATLESTSPKIQPTEAPGTNASSSSAAAATSATNTPSSNPSKKRRTSTSESAAASPEDGGEDEEEVETSSVSELPTSGENSVDERKTSEGTSRPSDLSNAPFALSAQADSEPRGRPNASKVALAASAAGGVAPATMAALIAASLEPEVDTANGGVMYLCRFINCGDTFKTRFSLKRHLKKHSGEKPYACTYQGCTKRFAEKSTLKRHVRIHTGEKPYRCSVAGCGKYFADRTNVKRHEMIHSGMRPYWCPHESCSRGYFWRRHLRKHMQAVHKDDAPAFEGTISDEDEDEEGGSDGEMDALDREDMEEVDVAANMQAPSAGRNHMFAAPGAAGNQPMAMKPVMMQGQPPMNMPLLQSQPQASMMYNPMMPQQQQMPLYSTMPVTSF